MTVNKLHKLLGKLIEQGHGRAAACVNKSTLTHNLEMDGAIILPVCGVVVRPIEMLGDDGGMKVRANGSACLQTTAILYGESGEPDTGMVFEHKANA